MKICTIDENTDTMVSDTMTSDENRVPDVNALRSAIPTHCFERSLFRSLSYVVRDLFLLSFMFLVGTMLPQIENAAVRVVCWILYGITQGFVFTGIWILAHECGHDSFSEYPRINTAVGFVLHSIILVPFFSWKYSHARHHRYANHMRKDTVFVPPRKSEYRQTFFTGSFLGHAEDAPLVSMGLFLGHQLLGWPAYILFNAGAGVESLVKTNRSSSFRQSHLDPGSGLFTKSERPFAALSNVGIGIVLTILFYAAKAVGYWNIALLYGFPYLIMNHWLVAITFLHHTHPELPRYDEDTWTYSKGALSTVDRDFGFIGRHMLHGIIEYHMIHHMFPKIPFYHAEEATRAVEPLLGKSYKRQSSSFLHDLWSTFSNCSYVEELKDSPGILWWTKSVQTSIS